MKQRKEIPSKILMLWCRYSWSENSSNNTVFYSTKIKNTIMPRIIRTTHKTYINETIKQNTR